MLILIAFSSLQDRKRRRERESERDKDRKKFRVDRRDEVDPEEKKRIKELARRMKEDQAKKEKDRETLSKIGIGGVTTLGKIPKIPKKTPSATDLKDKEKQKSGSGLSFSDMLGGLDSKPKTVRTPNIKNKTAAMLEGMTKSSPTSSSKSPKDSKDSKSSSRHNSSSSRSSSSSYSSSSKDKDAKKEPSPFMSSYSSTLKRESERSNSSKRPTLSIPENKKRQSEESSPKTPKSPHNVSDSSGFMDAIFSSIK